MAEAMLLGVAKSVLGQLSSPALKEALLVWNLKEDLERLRETIETITCFIYDAERRQSKERLVELWLSRLKAVLYDADDLFDAIAARDLHMQTMDGNTCMKEPQELLCLQNIPWNLLPSLRTLHFEGKLSSIPDRIQHLTSLQRLEIWGCWDFEEIPKWMIKLNYLRELIMHGCSPELKARCTPQTGTDWDLISHIPLVDVGFAADDVWW